jgi:hypothetical protein
MEVGDAEQNPKTEEQTRSHKGNQSGEHKIDKCI